MLFRLWNYLRGYVIIIVEGFFIEKFINICVRRRIPLWDVRMQKAQLATMRMSIRGFKLIRSVARKAGCRVSLLKKSGLPFVFSKYRRRKAFFAGAVLFIVLMNTLTSFIWSIEIAGNEELDTAYLEQVLAGKGIKPGTIKYGIDTDSAVSGLMLDIDKISWISIYVRGTKVKVDIRERIDMPEIVPRHIPCDIVAQKDGMIKQIVAKDGIEAVSEGDTVKKGQTLISGSIPLKDGEDRYRHVHAMGTVSARTWYEEEAQVQLTKTERLRTGRMIRNNTLVLFSWKLDVFHRKNRFTDYTESKSQKRLTIGEYLVFPFEWISVSYYEEKLLEAYVNEEDARREAVEEAHRKALEQVPEGALIVGREARFAQQDGTLTAKVMLECIEDIGVPERIGGN